MHSVAEDIVFVCVLAYICNVLQMVRAVLAVVCALCCGYYQNWSSWWYDLCFVQWCSVTQTHSGTAWQQGVVECSYIQHWRLPVTVCVCGGGGGCMGVCGCVWCPVILLRQSLAS